MLKLLKICNLKLVEFRTYPEGTFIMCRKSVQILLKIFPSMLIMSSNKDLNYGDIRIYIIQKI